MRSHAYYLLLSQREARATSRDQEPTYPKHNYIIRLGKVCLVVVLLGKLRWVRHIPRFAFYVRRGSVDRLRLQFTRFIIGKLRWRTRRYKNQRLYPTQ